MSNLEASEVTIIGILVSMIRKTGADVSWDFNALTNSPSSLPHLNGMFCANSV